GGARAATRPARRATGRSSAPAPRRRGRRWRPPAWPGLRGAAPSFLVFPGRRECARAGLHRGADLVLELEVLEVRVALEAHALEDGALFLDAHELVRRDLPAT